MHPTPDRPASCVFCSLPEDRVLLRNDRALAFPDAYPVTPGHTLVIPRRHVAGFFGLEAEERRAVFDLVAEARRALLDGDPSITGFNVGVNVGADAGQTVPHCHVHLIPRRKGDTGDARGGVRAVVPARRLYPSG